MKYLTATRIELHYELEVVAEITFGDHATLMVSHEAFPPDEPERYDWLPRTSVRLSAAPFMTPHKKSGRMNLYLKVHTTGEGASLLPVEGSAHIYAAHCEPPRLHPWARILMYSRGHESGSVPVENPEWVKLFYYG